MARLIGIVLIITVLAAGCSLVHEPHTTRVAEDFSHIEDPHKRWDAYELSSYTIEQTRTCECLPPYGYLVVVKNDSVADVSYEEPEETYGKDAETLREMALQSALTIEEMFDIIAREKNAADRFEVAYHPRYGYPTKVFIDPDEKTADEEIIRSMSNLRTFDE